jgi:uncharacterized protein (DUF305 family)
MKCTIAVRMIHVAACPREGSSVDDLACVIFKSETNDHQAMTRWSREWGIQGMDSSIPLLSLYARYA